MSPFRNLLLAGALSLAAAAAHAQTSPAQPNQPAPGTGPHMGSHMGGGMMGGGGMRGGGMRAGPGVTMGWSMMTPQERQAHQARMGSFKTYAECHAYVLEHHKLMAERAKAQGMSMPAEPRRDACAGLPR